MAAAVVSLVLRRQSVWCARETRGALWRSALSTAPALRVQQSLSARKEEKKRHIPKNELSHEQYLDALKFMKTDTDYYLDMAKMGRITVRTKNAIYAKHKEDPDKNTAAALAVEFGVKRQRIEAIIELGKIGEDLDAKFGKGWSDIYDEKGNVICIESELEKMLPMEYADRVDDRWLLKQRSTAIAAFDTLEDEVDQALMSKRLRIAKQSKAHWGRVKMRSLEVPEEQLPERIKVIKPFKLDYKFPAHSKEKLILVDESPVYTDFNRPMFNVHRDGTVWVCTWEERKEYMRHKYPEDYTKHMEAPLYMEAIPSPAPFDGSALSPELGHETRFLEHAQQESVTDELNRVCKTREELAKEGREDDEEFSLEDFNKFVDEMQAKEEQDEADRERHLQAYREYKDNLEKRMAYEVDLDL